MKVINFFGGAGAGKSTAAAGLFYEMKKRWIQAELVNEYAKELVWSGNEHMLSHQNLVFAEQEHRLNRLIGKVDVAISDSPLLLSSYYAPESYPVSFKQSVFDFFSNYDNVNIFVQRSHDYVQAGRLQNEEEAAAVSDSMELFLQDNGIPYYVIAANDASPLYLLHWLVAQELLELPPKAKPFEAEDAPPEGWLVPSYRRKTDANGRPIRTADAVAQRYIQAGIRTS